MGFLDGYKTYDPEVDGYGNESEWRRTYYRTMTDDEAHAILQEEDPYIILDVKRSATPAEIKKAFYILALNWHPDRNPKQVIKATRMMQKINAAYQLIK